MRTEAYDRAAGLLIGADESLSKPVDPDELLARVRKYAPPEEPPAEGEIAVPDLTKREREVARLLAEGRSQGEIAQALVISEKTVATHISTFSRSWACTAGRRPSRSPTGPVSWHRRAESAGGQCAPAGGGASQPAHSVV